MDFLLFEHPKTNAVNVQLNTALWDFFLSASPRNTPVLRQSCLSSPATVANVLTQENAGSNMQMIDVAEGEGA